MGKLKNLVSRKDDPILQFLKYGICGGIATATDFVAFYILSIWIIPGLGSEDSVVQLLNLDVPDMTEDVRSNRFLMNRSITFIISNAVAYITNVLFVFKAGRHSRKKEIILFYAVSGFSFAVGTGLGFSLIRFAGCTTTIAFLANIFVAVMVNYAGRKFFIFNG